MQQRPDHKPMSQSSENPGVLSPVHRLLGPVRALAVLGTPRQLAPQGCPCAPTPSCSHQAPGWCYLETGVLSFRELRLLGHSNAGDTAPGCPLCGTRRKTCVPAVQTQVRPSPRGGRAAAVTRQPRERVSAPRTPRNPRVGFFRDSNQAEKKKTK